MDGPVTDIAPGRLAVLADEAPLDHAAVLVVEGNITDTCGLGIVVGVGEVAEAHGLQFFGGISQDVAKGAVVFTALPVGTSDEDPDTGIVERTAEFLLAFHQFFIDRVQLYGSFLHSNLEIIAGAAQFLPVASDLITHGGETRDQEANFITSHSR